MLLPQMQVHLRFLDSADVLLIHARSARHVEQLVTNAGKRVTLQQSAVRATSCNVLNCVQSGGSIQAKFVDIKDDGMPLRFKVNSSAKVIVIPSTFPGIPAQLDVLEGKLEGPTGQS